MKLTDFQEIKLDKVWYDIKSKKPLILWAKQVSLYPDKVYFLVNAKGVITNWYRVNVTRVLDIPYGYRLVAIDSKNRSLIAKLLKSDKIMFER